MHDGSLCQRVSLLRSPDPVIVQPIPFSFLPYGSGRWDSNPGYQYGRTDVLTVRPHPLMFYEVQGSSDLIYSPIPGIRFPSLSWERELGVEPRLSERSFGRHTVRPPPLIVYQGSSSSVLTYSPMPGIRQPHLGEFWSASQPHILRMKASAPFKGTHRAPGWGASRCSPSQDALWTVVRFMCFLLH